MTDFRPSRAEDEWWTLHFFCGLFDIRIPTDPWGDALPWYTLPDALVTLYARRNHGKDGSR
jgi:hypothetical protein